MFTSSLLIDVLRQHNVYVGEPKSGIEGYEDNQVDLPILENLAEALNTHVATFMPDGAPALTLSKLQAELIRDLLAPGWAMHSVKITAFEQLAHLPMYASTLGTPESYREVNAARQALGQIEYVLSALTMMKPEIDPKNFIQFLRDPETKIIAPLYNHLMALQYVEKLARAWQGIEVFQEGAPN